MTAEPMRGSAIVVDPTVQVMNPRLTGVQHLAAAIASDDVGIPEIIAALRAKCALHGVEPSGNLRGLLHQWDKDKAEIEGWWARVMENQRRKQAEAKSRARRAEMERQ